jgi:hypothetical protein
MARGETPQLKIDAMGLPFCYPHARSLPKAISYLGKCCRGFDRKDARDGDEKL